MKAIATGIPGYQISHTKCMEDALWVTKENKDFRRERRCVINIYCMKLSVESILQNSGSFMEQLWALKIHIK